MTNEDINKVTAAVLAQLRQGATDVDGIEPSAELADTDNVLADSGSALKKLPVSLFKKIVASGAEAYRLVTSAQIYKSTTTAVSVGVVHGSGGSVEQMAELPKGWKIEVHWEGAELSKDSTMGIGTLNPNELAGATSVELTLYDGDPTVAVDGKKAQAIDSTTLLLVADGKDGKDGAKGDTGAAGEKGEKGDKGDAGAKGGEEVLYDECYYPNKAATTDTSRYTDSTEILQPTGYVGDYTDADGKQWTGVFTCESFPDWFNAVQGLCYPYGNGVSMGIPFVKHTWTVTDGKLVWNFYDNQFDATVPCFEIVTSYGLKKIDDTHFTVYSDKGNTRVWDNYDKTKIDCAKFAFGNPALNTLYDVTGCKKIRVRLMGQISTPSKYESLVPDTSPFAMRNYINVQTLYANNYAEYELGDSSYAVTRHGSTSWYRTSYTQSPQLLSGEFTVNVGTSKFAQFTFKLYKTGGKTYFCLNAGNNPSVKIAMGTRIIIEKLE